MGADMHFYVEYKDDKGEWKYISLLDNDGDPISYYYRNYQLFGLLAEVRALGIPGFTKEHCSVPADLSEEVKKEWQHWEDDAHSFTLYYLSELHMFIKYLQLETEKEKLQYNFNKIVNNEDDIYLGESIHETVESYKILENFGYFINLVLYFNNVYVDDNNVRIIMWFDN